MDAGFQPTNNEQSQANGYGTYTLSPAEQQHEKKATTAMVLGILGDISFPLPVFNLAGLTLSILALVRANANRRFAKEQAIPENGKNIAGRWCGIGGIVLNALSILFWLAMILITVFALLIAFRSGTTTFAEKMF